MVCASLLLFLRCPCVMRMSCLVCHRFSANLLHVLPVFFCLGWSALLHSLFFVC